MTCLEDMASSIELPPGGRTVFPRFEKTAKLKLQLCGFRTLSVVPFVPVAEREVRWHSSPSRLEPGSHPLETALLRGHLAKWLVFGVITGWVNLPASRPQLFEQWAADNAEDIATVWNVDEATRTRIAARCPLCPRPVAPRRQRRTARQIACFGHDPPCCPVRSYCRFQASLRSGIKGFKFVFAPNGTFAGVTTFPASNAAIPDIPGKPPLLVPNLQVRTGRGGATCLPIAPGGGRLRL